MDEAVPTDRAPHERRTPPRRVMEPQAAFLELGRLDLEALELGQVLTRVAELAQATVPGADEVSVTLIEDGRARSAAFTGDLAVHLDERQYAAGFGPCMDASLAGEVISIPDTSHDERYPDFGAIAARAGVGSSLSVGMPVPQRTVGGLNFYAGGAHAFDAQAVDLARAFADYAAVALVNAGLVDSKMTLARQLEAAMASRAVIEQAKGILMGRLGVSPEQAFAHLAKQSQNTNRKLHDVAATLIAQTRTP